MYDDKELVDKIIRGDLNNFKLLIKRYEKLVFHMVNKFGLDEDDLNDVCQEIFIKVYNNLKSFRFQSKLSTWIARIAYSTALNHVQKRSVRDRKNKADLVEIENVHLSLDNPEHLMSQKDMGTMLNREIEKLPEQYKLVLTLYHMNEFSYEEIQEITGMPEGTVKNYLFRARKILKEKLATVYQLHSMSE